MAPPAEISIPTTSLNKSPDGKPYTVYNIILRLPLRSFVVQKRYSDFDKLHQTLVSLVGAPPPKPLPVKSWFRSTVSSGELTESRRKGLEGYLKAIAEDPDRRWRDTPAWRAFLNLPSGSTTNSAASTSGTGVEGRIPVIGLREPNAAAATDPSTWLDLHREMKDALREARAALNRRDDATDNSVRLEAGAAAKRHLIRAGNLLNTLEEGLGRLKDSARLGAGEVRRRRDLVAAAKLDRDGLEKLSLSMAGNPATALGVVGSRSATPSAGDRGELMGNASTRTPPRGGRVLGAPRPETERTRELDNNGVLQLQQDMMTDQDGYLGTLAATVRRQKEMGLAINEEVERQVEMLTHMDSQVDVVGRKIAIAKKRTNALG